MKYTIAGIKTSEQLKPYHCQKKKKKKKKRKTQKNEKEKNQ
jgi:hypothetical protein